MLYPIKFEPIFKNKIWGGSKLKSILNKKNTKGNNLGESWELSSIQEDESVVTNGFLKGNTINEIIEIYMGDLVGDKIFETFGVNFPLLFKFIDANKDLSVQVHPANEFAIKHHESYGKTEMWYILDAEKDAKIISGLKPDVDKEILSNSIKNNSILEQLNIVNVQKDDVFFIPPGHIHSIGKGVLLAEIQQTSDITYRLFDYNRKENGKERELHIDFALQNINFKEKNVGLVQYKASEIKTELIECEYFTTNLLRIEKAIEKDYNQIDSFVVYMCIEGEINIKYNDEITNIQKGETVLIPAEMKNFDIYPESKSKLLEIYIS